MSTAYEARTVCPLVGAQLRVRAAAWRPPARALLAAAWDPGGRPGGLRIKGRILQAHCLGSHTVWDRGGDADVVGRRCLQNKPASGPAAVRGIQHTVRVQEGPEHLVVWAAVAPAGSAWHVGDRGPCVDNHRELLRWCSQMERGIKVPEAVPQPSAQRCAHSSSLEKCML